MIVLTGNPISTQHLYLQKGHLRFMSKEGKTLKEQYQWEAKKQWKKPMLTIPLEIDITLYFGNKRRRDWDNWHKLTCDALSGIVYEDDSQILDAHVHKRYDATNPRIEIEIL